MKWIQTGIWLSFAVHISLCQVHAQQIELSAGHVMARTASDMTAALFEQLNETLTDVRIAYEPSTVDPSTADSNRWARRVRLEDIVFVYAGQLLIQDEVSRLGGSGRIQALDAIPGFRDKVNLQDIYSNLLEPARIGGQLFAVPIRACPPAVAVKKNIVSGFDSWDKVIEFASTHNFMPVFESDYYHLWRTLLMANNQDISKGSNRFELDTNAAGEMFGRVLALARANRNNRYSEALPLDIVTAADMLLVNPDVVTDIPGMTDLYDVYPFPSAANAQVMSMSRSWYLALSAHVAGPARRAALEVIALLLSKEWQVRIAGLSNSATVRPSIGESAEFAELFPPRSPVFAFQRTVPNLHIPKADVRVASAERDLSTAFSSALANPDEFGVIMAKAVHDANRIVSK